MPTPTPTPRGTRIKLPMLAPVPVSTSARRNKLLAAVARQLGATLALILALWGGAGHPVHAAAKDSQPARPPNFVVIFADDMGYGDLGCYGSPRNKTPNLDRLAKEGVRFTSFYVPQAVCSASRAALLTGCYPNRIGILGALSHRSKAVLNPEEHTIPEVLKPKGYASAIYGKWHLGHIPPCLPTFHGFDDYFGLPYSNDMWPNHPTAGKDYPPLPLFSGTNVVATMPDQTQLTRWYTEHAVSFIRKNRDRPFFLYVPHSMPHVPLHASKGFDGKSGAGIYADVMAEIDWSAGQIVAALKANKLEANTVVVFVSDNGPWLAYGDHAGVAGPLREGKGTTFEGGVRVPCIVKWPGKIPAGSVCNEMAWTMDLLPTFAQISGATLADDKAIDGKSIVDLLQNPTAAKTPHEAFYYYWDRHLQAVRSGPWKLHLPHPYQHIKTPGTNGKPGVLEFPTIGQSLYNLDEDISESHDVAAAHPDIVARLLAIAQTAREDLGDNAPGQQPVAGRNVRPPAKLAE